MHPAGVPAGSGPYRMRKGPGGFLRILYFLCDVAAYYGFLDGVKWENIINVKEELEDDLKEYIAEIIELR